MPRRRSIVELADEIVPIVSACKFAGMDLPEGLEYRRSVKLYCPFGDIFHVDRGAERAMRLYVGSNSCFCFAGCGYFTPTRLAAMAWDLSRTAAAIELLNRVGYRPVSPAEAWRRAAEPDDQPDPVALRDALQTYCRRICPQWGEIQFDPEVAAILTQCLQLLTRVHNSNDADQWLAGVKIVMGRALSSRDAVPRANP